MAVYVPVTVEALAVGKKKAKPGFTDLTVKYDKIPDTMPFTSEAVNDAFAVSDEMQGIHLFWRMPDALLRGEQKADGTLFFYDLPDKWIVRRIHTGEKEISCETWIVESRCCSSEEAQTENGMYKTTVPGEGIYTYLGGARKPDTPPAKDRKKLSKLTAVETGDMMFTAFYPYSRTVFGFYDDMKELPEGDYTYQVIGYYDDAGRDPLKTGGRRRMEEFGWVCDGDITGGTICHGVVRNVEWKGKNADYPSGVPKGKIEVSIGNTSVETLSLYYSRGNRNAQSMERGLAALQYGCLDELDRPDRADSLIYLEEKLHEKEFAGEDGGTLWLAEAGDGHKNPAMTELTDDEYDGLLELNALQKELDNGRADAKSLRTEAFDAWYRYAALLDDPWNAATDEPGVYLEMAGEKAETLRRLQDRLKDGADELERKKEKLDEELAKRNIHLKQIPDGLYYTPNQPVIQLAGEGLRRSYHQGFQTDESGKLPCRKKTVEEISICAEERTEKITFSDIPVQWKEETGERDEIRQASKALFAEEILTNAATAGLLADAVLKREGADEKERSKLQEAVEEAQRHVDQTPFAIAVREWEQPWSPVMMAWSFRIEAAGFEEFRLGEIDLEPSEKVSGIGKETVISGITALTPHATENLGYVLRTACGKKETNGSFPNVEKLAEESAKAQFLSQQADGFHAGMKMKRRLPMLPIVRVSAESADTAKLLGRLLEDYEYQPVPDGEFLPVRAGRMRPERLRLIDAFGRYKDIPVDEEPVYISESMKSGEDGVALLRPRMLQPCRIEFRWLSHRKGTAAADANSSPVFGFIVADFLDAGLQVYDDEGVFQGVICQRRDDVLWRGNMEPAVPVEEIKNAHLKLFVQGLVKQNSSGLSELLEVLKTGFRASVPDHTDAFRQLCFGRVMALCRGSVSVAGKGRKLYSQAQEMRREESGYDSEKFSVRIGDGRKEQNGLMGFFTGGENAETYKKFYSCFSPKAQSGEYVVYDSDLRISLEDEPKELTLLMDPAGKITVRTGFLPRKECILDPVLYARQMDRIDMEFRAMPVLAEPGDLRLPVPGNLSGEWEFVYKDGRKAACKAVDIAETVPAAAGKDLRIPGRIFQMETEGLKIKGFDFDKLSIDISRNVLTMGRKTEFEVYLKNNSTEPLKFPNPGELRPEDMPRYDEAPIDAETVSCYIRFDYGDGAGDFTTKADSKLITGSLVGRTDWDIIREDTKPLSPYWIFGPKKDACLKPGDSIIIRIGDVRCSEVCGIAALHFRIKCGGNYDKDLRIRKVYMPQILHFEPSWKDYHLGDVIRMEWELEDAEECSVEFCGQKISPSETRKEVVVKSDDVYVLTAENPAGDVADAQYRTEVPCIDTFTLEKINREEVTLKWRVFESDTEYVCLKEIPEATLKPEDMQTFKKLTEADTAFTLSARQKNSARTVERRIVYRIPYFTEVSAQRHNKLCEADVIPDVGDEFIPLDMLYETNEAGSGYVTYKGPAPIEKVYADFTWKTVGMETVEIYVSGVSKGIYQSEGSATIEINPDSREAIVVGTDRYGYQVKQQVDIR